MRPIEAVLFDFGGTLDADGVRWAVRFHASYRAAGGGRELAEFEMVFRDTDRHLLLIPGIERLGFRAMINAQTRLLLALLPDGAQLNGEQIAADFHDRALIVVRRNAAMLDRLAARWPLGVVSNFSGNLERCLEELDLMRYFRVALDSAVVGREKPDPHLFELARSSLASGAAGTWMVGDNPEADIRPALKLGMKGCWLAAPDRPLPAGLAPTARITRLTDLPACLEG
jgi:putative hydrolase of the HAD superfamily